MTLLQHLALPLLASDHADPIAFPGVMELFDDGKPTAKAAASLSGGITDLIVFPLLANGQVADFTSPDRKDLTLTPEEKSQIKSMAVILCVRRALTKTKAVDLEPYTYSVHMDLRSAVAFKNDGDQARYGGTVVKPEELNSDVRFDIQLKNDATVKGFTVQNPKKYLKNTDGVHLYNAAPLGGRMDEVMQNPKDLHLYTGFRDDPFIFPPFFGTNAVAMIMLIPIEDFPEGQQDWIIWATSSKGGKQVDHAGRSLRTQQPRFEILNKIPPREQVAAIKDAEDHPTLMRDLGNKFTIQQLFS